jgi:hypothetical protein
MTTPERTIGGPLAEFVRSCLPSGATLHSLERQGAIFVASFDQGGCRSAIEWRDVTVAGPRFRAGRRLAFSHRSESADADPAAGTSVIEALLAAEDRLSALSREFPEGRLEAAPAGGECASRNRVLFLRELPLSAQVARALVRMQSIREATRIVVGSLLGPDPHDVEVHLYFDRRCGQACEFCEQPRVRDRVGHRILAAALGAEQRIGMDLVGSGAFAALLDILWSRHEPIPLTITGNDWLRHPRLDELLRALERPRAARLRLQGPSLALAAPLLAARVTTLPGLEWIAIGLQSSDPAEHDAMVGLDGAHARLTAALEHLGGTPVRLSLVLTRRALRTLPQTLRWAGAQHRRILANAFLPDRGMGDVADRLAPVDAVRDALQRAGAAAAEGLSGLVNVPMCAVPESLRSLVVATPRTPERDVSVFASVCSTCADSDRCPGLAPGYLTAFGTQGLRPRERSRAAPRFRAEHL